MPGYIFFKLLHGLSQTIPDDKLYFSFHSVVASVVFRSLIEVAQRYWFNGAETNSLIRIFIMCVLSTAIALIISFISSIEAARKITTTLFHRTYEPNFWEGVFNLENGCAVEIILKGGATRIIGNFDVMQEKSTDPWIGLSEYTVYKDGGITIDADGEDGKHTILVRMSDVELVSVADWLTKCK